jgi:uncharacterized protein YndB with AHSA1/START domain
MCNHSVAMSSVERELVLDAPLEEVWRAVSDEAMLSEWLAPEVELDLRPHGALVCRTEDGEERWGAVELIEEGERLAFHWQRDGAAPSRVEIQLEDLDGATRLRVVESGLDASAGPRASGLWSKRFESLQLALASLAYA